jgi:signal transduction histidine kinase
MEANQIEAHCISEFFANQENIADEILKDKKRMQQEESKRKNVKFDDWQSVILLKKKITLVSDKLINGFLQEQIKREQDYLFDINEQEIFIKRTVNEQEIIYFPFNIVDIQKKIKTINANYYHKLIYSDSTFYIEISDTNFSMNKNSSLLNAGNYLQYSSTLNNNWLLTTYRPTINLYDKLYFFLKEMFIAIIVIGIIFFIAAFFLANKIVTPIRLLAEAAEKISRGELCDKANDKSKNELKTMGDQFDSMRIKLKAAYENLERKIEERTKALQEAQFQVSHQEKMASLGLMAAGVAHEIGNPLTSISSLTQIIKRKIDDPQQIKYADTILENIERISVIVHELVDFARPASYRALMSNINEIIRNAVNIVRYDRRAKQVDLELELQNDLPPVQLVADQLLQVFINILINAVDALGENDNLVTVKSFSKNDIIYIIFRDTGAGIDSESIDKIFQPFFTTKEVGKGTGLGLSVSYGIVKNLNGKIEVKSKLGMGSQFTVEIPIDQSCGKKGDNI